MAANGELTKSPFLFPEEGEGQRTPSKGESKDFANPQGESVYNLGDVVELEQILVNEEEEEEIKELVGNSVARNIRRSKKILRQKSALSKFGPVKEVPEEEESKSELGAVESSYESEFEINVKNSMKRLQRNLELNMIREMVRGESNTPLQSELISEIESLRSPLRGGPEGAVEKRKTDLEMRLERDLAQMERKEEQRRAAQAEKRVAKKKSVCCTTF